MLTKESVERAKRMAHYAREMRDRKAYCFGCGSTALLCNDPEDEPENGFRCEYCSEMVCEGCQSTRITDVKCCNMCQEAL